MLKNRAFRTAALLAVSLGLAPTALAETPQTNRPYIFETVDSYGIVSTSRFEVTGILQGESAPRTFVFSYSSAHSYDDSQHLSRCDRMALLAMSKPGFYYFEMVETHLYTGPICRLRRR
ncbi:hypothetical protein ACLESO_26690 [Pyxidicoccus sp. 3LG]